MFFSEESFGEQSQSLMTLPEFPINEVHVLSCNQNIFGYTSNSSLIPHTNFNSIIISTCVKESETMYSEQTSNLTLLNNSRSVNLLTPSSLLETKSHIPQLLYPFLTQLPLPISSSLVLTPLPQFSIILH